MALGLKGFAPDEERSAKAGAYCADRVTVSMSDSGLRKRVTWRPSDVRRWALVSAV